MNATTEGHVETGLLFQFLDGDLLDAECVEVEQHLASCATCRKTYRKLLEREERITELLFDAALKKAPPIRPRPIATSKTGGSYPMMPVVVSMPEPARLRAPSRHRFPVILVGSVVMLSLWGYLLYDWLLGAPADGTFEELRLTQRRMSARPEVEKVVTSDGEEVPVDYEFGVFVRVALIRSGQVAVYHRMSDGRVELVTPTSGEPLPALEPNASALLPSGGSGIVPSSLGSRGTVIVIPFHTTPSREMLVDLADWLTNAGLEKREGDWQDPLRRRFPDARLLPYRVEDLDRL
ncbi:MAG: zf-HC2 domain-containing protein [Planctomycetota bacterium]